MPALPITRVVLYKHGVGYFEREGPVENDATRAFTFKQGEVSDVLKSLLVSALSLLTLIIAWNWSALGGGKSGPKIIEGSPWEKRKATGGPKGAQSGGQQDQ